MGFAIFPSNVQKTPEAGSNFDSLVASNRGNFNYSLSSIASNSNQIVIDAGDGAQQWNIAGVGEERERAQHDKDVDGVNERGHKRRLHT
jgi:hypothetical protein